MNYDSSLFT